MYFLCKFFMLILFFSCLLINKMLFWFNTSLVRIILMIRLGVTLVDLFLTLPSFIYINILLWPHYGPEIKTQERN